jgi:hypothetical protein
MNEIDELTDALNVVEAALALEFSVPLGLVRQELHRRSKAGCLEETPMVMQWLSITAALFDAGYTTLE